jgi:hypothetical protein
MQITIQNSPISCWYVDAKCTYRWSSSCKFRWKSTLAKIQGMKRDFKNDLLKDWLLCKMLSPTYDSLSIDQSLLSSAKYPTLRELNTLMLELICCKRIYNFWCSMLVLHQLLYVLFTLRGIFMHFSELTKKLHRKYSRNWTKRKPKFLFTLHKDGVQRRDGEGPGGGHTIGRCILPPVRAIRWCGPLVHPLTSPFRL